jgi:hypothetical protein
VSFRPPQLFSSLYTQQSVYHLCMQSIQCMGYMTGSCFDNFSLRVSDE